MGHRPVEGCCLAALSGASAGLDGVPWMVPTTGLVPCARARRRSSCHPVASRAGAAVGPQGAVLLEEAIGSSWVAVLLLKKGCSTKVGWASTLLWQLLAFDPVTLSPSVTY